MSVEEILAALATEVGSDKAKAKDIAKQLRTVVPTLGQELLNSGAAAQKRGTEAEHTKLTKERDDALAELETVRGEFNEFKTKTPDAAAIEAKAAEKFGKKIKTLEDAAAAKDLTLRGKLSEITREKLITRLVTEEHVDKDYAREVLAAKHADRIDVGEDWKVKVLQLGEANEYDGETEEQKVALLAKDLGKTVPNKFIETNADHGGGMGGERGGGGGGGYDPVKAGKEMAEQQKKTGPKENDLAFR